MIEDKISEKLMPLTLEQLVLVETQLEKMVAEKKEAKKRASRFPPVTHNDLDSLAALQGLDVSGLMREISRR